MKIKKINTFKLVCTLDKLGIDYHEYGTLEKKSSNGRKIKTHDYYKTDRLSNKQKKILNRLFPSLEFFTSKSQFAPEIRGGIIASPKAYRIKELNANL